jgi:hypothetical protein
MKTNHAISIVAAAVVTVVLSGLALAADPPDKITIDKLENLWEPCVFDHKLHTGAADDCKTCHHKGQGETMACSGCHKIPYDKQNLAVRGYKGALHDQCMGCHEKMEITNTCESCHKPKPKQP